MDFLKYSNKTQTNIFPKEDFENLVHGVFNTISENICKSLGPLGSSATILEGMLEPVATKDGYSILTKYAFRNDYKRMIYNLIKAPCTRMNNIVGDGTTTAIALTTALFNRYENQKQALSTLYRLPRQFTKVWDNVIEDLQKRIMDQAIPIDPKDHDTIYNIAYVTSNGNEEVSEAVAKVYVEAEAPYIKQKDSPTSESYIEMVNGFNFPANLLSEAYTRNQDMSSEENNIAVMVFNFKLETDFVQSVIIPINEVMRAKGHKLLVIAPQFDHKMCDTLLGQYTLMERRSPYGINLILAQYSSSDLKDHQLRDLCTVLKTKIINDNIAAKILEEIKVASVDAIIEKSESDESYELARICGIAEYALLSMSAGSLFRPQPDIVDDEFYQDALKNAKNALQNIIDSNNAERNSLSHKVYQARDRILQLEMKNYIYYVGAGSQLQKNILWDSITDVIKCVRSAVRCGVVPGCQLTIIRSCDDIVEEIVNNYPENTNYNDMTPEDKLKQQIVSIIKFACIDVYCKILHGPDKMGIVKTLNRWQYTTPEGADELGKETMDKVTTIINSSIERNEVFDMETLDYNPNIITSAETDQLVLLAASELVKILISGNQAIIVRVDVDSSHEEQVMM